MPPLVWPLAAWIAGIAAGPHLDTRFVWLTLAPALAVAAARPRTALLVVFLIGAGLRAEREPAPQPIIDDGLPVRLTARLEGPPLWKSPGYAMDVAVLAVGGRQWQGRARLSYFPSEDDHPELEDLFLGLGLGSGDRIEVLVRLRPPNVHRNPGVFDYRRFLERRGIYWTGAIRSPRLIHVIDRGWHGPDRVRAWATRKVAVHFEDAPEIQALVLGMVLGQRRRLPAEVSWKFRTAGVIHFLVVSGFHMALVAATALWAGRRIPFGRWHRTSSMLFALAVTLGYAFLVEGGAPVARAALMASLLLLGSLMDRGCRIGNSLAAAAIAILAANPLALEDAGFQWTFASVLAIVLLAAPWIRWQLGWRIDAIRGFSNTALDAALEARTADWRVSRRLACELRGRPLWTATLPSKIGLAIGQAAIVTISVQSVLLPLMVESHHRVSPVSVPLNVAGAFVAAFVTATGLLLIALPEFLGSLLSVPMKRLLEIFIFLVERGLELPWASLRVPSPPPWIWAIHAAALGGLALALKRRSPWAAAAAALTLGACVAAAAVWDFSPSPPTHPVLTFIDVGQGDSTLIELPDGRRIVVDGGGVFTGSTSGRDEGAFSIGEDVVSAHLFSRGIRRLDALVLTHAHHDHMDGLFDLLRNFEVGAVWLGVNPLTPAYQRFIEDVERRGVPIVWVRAGDRIPPFEVLNPPPGRTPGRNVRNEDSVVLLLRTPEGRTALLTGDSEAHLPAMPDHVDVLQVPHHGSRFSSLRVRARIPVISVGAFNNFGHPDPTKLPALRTDLHGAIRVKLHPDGPRVSFPGL